MGREGHTQLKTQNSVAIFSLEGHKGAMGMLHIL